MSFTFFNQWLQWFSDEPFAWTEFDIINVSFERDSVGKDWSADIGLLGLGFHFHYVTKAGEDYWYDMVDGIREREQANNDKGGDDE